jgi:Periplasmic binding protein
VKTIFSKPLSAVALCIATAFSASAFAQVKIGFMATMSGPSALLGQDQFDGFMLGIEHSGGTLGGQKVEVLKEDDQLKVDVGVQTIQKFIEKDKVDIITGVTFSNVMMAISKPLADSGSIFVGSNAGPAPLAGAQCNQNFFFTSWQNDNQAEVMGKYAMELVKISLQASSAPTPARSQARCTPHSASLITPLKSRKCKRPTRMRCLCFIPAAWAWPLCARCAKPAL